jgi:hypothetical protein
MSPKTDRESGMQAILSRAFGFDPAESLHHFLIKIPQGTTRKIEFSGHFTWGAVSGSSPMTLGAGSGGQIRVLLARPKWDAIADEVRAEFNRRLKSSGKKTGSWRVGPNWVRRELGKELVLLSWAIEDADPTLVPEERWWLYTQTAAATGHGVNDRGKGWRKAVRFALTENPVTTSPSDRRTVPDYFRTASQLSIFQRSPKLPEIKQHEEE